MLEGLPLRFGMQTKWVKLPYFFLVAAYDINTGLILDKLLETSSLTDCHMHQIFFFKLDANSLIDVP